MYIILILQSILFLRYYLPNRVLKNVKNTCDKCSQNVYGENTHK